MNAPPITFSWDGEAMVPLARFQRVCDRVFVVGETYPLIIHEERSANSHKHFFAAVNEAWKNLPDDLAMEFPTPEHLRKKSLIRAGFAAERSIACSSKLEARKIAAFIKPMDEYAIVAVNDCTIKVFTAQSQSVKAMGKVEFQKSKQAVLDICAMLIGVSADDLAANAGRAA